MVAGTCEECGVLAGVGEPSALSSCCYRLAGARSTWCLHERQVGVECLERACPGLLVRHAQEPQPGVPAWSQPGARPMAWGRWVGWRRDAEPCQALVSPEHTAQLPSQALGTAAA